MVQPHNELPAHIALGSPYFFSRKKHTQKEHLDRQISKRSRTAFFNAYPMDQFPIAVTPLALDDLRMNFTGPIFLLLLLVLFLLFWPSPARYRSGLLLAGSYLFYAWWDLRFIPILLAATALDFTMGKKIGKTENPALRRTFLIFSVTANLLILLFCKYANFFLSSANDIKNMFAQSPQLYVPISLFVPLGVSFYTFHSISYVVDVFRKKTPPCQSIKEYALYVTFFPKLISGPIERTENFLPQLRLNQKFSLPYFMQAIRMMAMGYLLKLCVADRLTGVTDRVFHEPLLFSIASRWATLYAYSFQIYADFFGYTLIAQGAALLFGIRLSENFRSPYLASDLQEFWRRWHISLSTWFRDYVYIPLGGGKNHVTQNLIITMALAGLWHGASLHFIVWGLYHGVILAVSRTLPLPKLPRFLGVFLTFHLVSLGWVFFRADSVTAAIDFLRGMTNFNSTTGIDGIIELLLIVLGIWSLGIFLVKAHERLCSNSNDKEFTFKNALAGLPLGLLLAVIIIAGASNAKPFVYFHF